jgi:hypothetical protein
MKLLKLLIKLALFGLIANGAYQVGFAYWTHYNFRDDVQDMVTFRKDKDDVFTRKDKDDAWVRDRIVDLAARYDVPVADKAIEINSEGSHTQITIYYVRQISIVPGVKRDWPFAMHIDSLRLY